MSPRKPKVVNVNGLPPDKVQTTYVVTLELPCRSEESARGAVETAMGQIGLTDDSYFPKHYCITRCERHSTQLAWYVVNVEMHGQPHRFEVENELRRGMNALCQYRAFVTNYKIARIRAVTPS